jgi:hypothetical protein
MLLSPFIPPPFSVTIYMHICVCVCMYVFVHVYLYMYVCTYVSIHNNLANKDMGNVLSK